MSEQSKYESWAVLDLCRTDTIGAKAELGRRASLLDAVRAELAEQKGLFDTLASLARGVQKERDELWSRAERAEAELAELRSEQRGLWDLVSERCGISLPCLVEMSLVELANALQNQARTEEE